MFKSTQSKQIHTTMSFLFNLANQNANASGSDSDSSSSEDEEVIHGVPPAEAQYMNRDPPAITSAIGNRRTFHSTQQNIEGANQPPIEYDDITVTWNCLTRHFESVILPMLPEAKESMEDAYERVRRPCRPQNWRTEGVTNEVLSLREETKTEYVWRITRYPGGVRAIRVRKNGLQKKPYRSYPFHIPIRRQPSLEGEYYKFIGLFEQYRHNKNFDDQRNEKMLKHILRRNDYLEALVEQYRLRYDVEQQQPPAQADEEVQHQPPAQAEE